jgi:hypothetical protein
MNLIRRGGWSSLLMGVVVLSALGCATSGTRKEITVSDMSSLAGTWNGTLTTPDGKSGGGSIVLSPSGDYTVSALGFTAQGKAQPKDGNLALIATATSGGGERR